MKIAIACLGVVAFASSAFADGGLVYFTEQEQFNTHMLTHNKVMKGIEDGIKREIDEATEKCKASPPPPMDIITTDVYADGGFAWRN